MSKKVLFVATVVKTHIMEFHLPYLELFKKHGWETAVAARNDYDNKRDCVIPFCDNYYDLPFERNPFSVNNLTLIKKLKKIIDEDNYDIIHCHTPVGALVARLASIDARKKGSRVIYTAHGFHFYKGAPIINWLLYFPVEKFLSHFTDTIITINKEDYHIAKSFSTKDVQFVHGVGIDTIKFSLSDKREVKRKELGITDSDFALLAVGELIPRKNHILILSALRYLKEIGELNNIKLFICGNGRLNKKLIQYVEKYKLKDYVYFLGYRQDISDICKACDLFVFMSKQEGLPVALMESMASKLPIVCSNIRGNRDLIYDGFSGKYSDFSENNLSDSILFMKNNKEIRKEYANNAYQSVLKYDLNMVKEEMSQIYFNK